MTAVHVAALRHESDAYNRAMAVVLCHPAFVHRAEIADNVDAEGIDWDRILAAPWSGGERVLLQAAANLWRGHGAVDLARLASLSDGFYAMFGRMLTAYRGEPLGAPERLP